MSITVSTILDRKGDDVVTVGTSATVGEVVRSLAEHNIGALIVSDDGGRTVAGIISERDIVRRLTESATGGVDDHGDPVTDLTVRDVMTPAVATCGPDDSADELMATMTTSRVRHLPVIADGRLAGIVSIGDVVKSRIDDLETQTEALRDYVTGSGY